MTQTIDYKYCDVVMKGGITSGIVYPLAVVELAKKYSFKNIGGTSAGAIAAAMTAAAEYGRRSGNPNSFDVIEGLPNKLGSDGLLVKLFQPSPGTTRVFRVAIAALAAKRGAARVRGVLRSLVTEFWISALIGGVIGFSIPFALFLWFGGSPLPFIILGLVWVALAVAISVGVSAVKNALAAISINRFGLCSGFDREPNDGQPPLTNWLHAEIQRASGRSVDDPPLTFGDVWAANQYVGEELKTDRTINLNVVTTGLTQGRPFTLPFETDQFYFAEEEFRALFPERVVKWLSDHQRPPKHEKHLVVSDRKEPLSRLPHPADMPILVAVRMSLSFPILLSAVPLHAVDYSLKRNHEVPADQALIAERCWFSDGGICSNFPIHFFDSPLPRWPTFGINLKSPHPDHQKCEGEMVWLPEKPGTDVQVNWNDFDKGSASERLFGFLTAIANTMQNWRDNLQASAPDYRSRIVQISLKRDEGGLNLAMPDELIKKLGKRGRVAGERLRDQFDFGSHIWARFRLTMCCFGSYLQNLRMSWTDRTRQNEQGHEYINGEAEPLHYKCSPEMHALLSNALNDLVKVSEGWKERPGDHKFCEDHEPTPEPILRSQPKF